jgi:hypothetical protein
MPSASQQRVKCETCHRRYQKSYLPHHKCNPGIPVNDDKIIEHNAALIRHHEGFLVIGDMLDRHEREFDRIVNEVNTRLLYIRLYFFIATVVVVIWLVRLSL